MLLDYFGIVIMAILGGARLYQTLSGEWWALPLFAHAMLSALMLVLHRKTGRQAPLFQRLAAWGSALLPYAIRIDRPVPVFLRALSLCGCRGRHLGHPDAGQILRRITGGSRFGQ
jgi:hypothetical protein